MMDRRAFLAASAATGSAFAAAWLDADPVALARSYEAARRAANGGPPELEFLTPEQAADVDAIAAQIVPSDDLPGAREAHAVAFIDHGLATWAQDRREVFTRGLDELNAEVERRWPGTGRFGNLAAERQTELVRERFDGPFLQEMWFAVLAGTFGHPNWRGNHEGAGWRILGFEPRYAWQPPFGEYDAEAAGGN
jgi:gluconate 2-dehydrogenase gamma chain